jgi:hypothetical protein
MEPLLVTVGIAVTVVTGNLLHSTQPATRTDDCAARIVLLGSPNRVSIRNLGDATWTDARLAIYGQITSGPNAGQPAGVHTLQRSIDPGITMFQLAEFQTDDGTRWAPSTTRVDRIGISATVRGERCELEHTFDH